MQRRGIVPHRSRGISGSLVGYSDHPGTQYTRIPDRRSDATATVACRFQETRDAVRTIRGGIPNVLSSTV
jgi:hypothetical protein